ncbi:hypothetical protein GCM10010211_82090 [Streptomyces albospinus]|uniref:Uncharacterized protein n=1 Tax=Streptomyces albospinus TaxID=285515 RepID=A0ABQ2VP86_9ACTN|nr:hypothetical protein GCM10010211_82090 [Streptomyces albospinus]
MIQALPLVLPGALVDLHRIDLTALYSTGWGAQAADVEAAPNGDVYGVRRYTRDRHVGGGKHLVSTGGSRGVVERWFGSAGQPAGGGLW